MYMLHDGSSVFDISH